MTEGQLIIKIFRAFIKLYLMFQSILLNRSILDNIGLTETSNMVNKDKAIKSSKIAKIYDFVQN